MKTTRRSFDRILPHGDFTAYRLNGDYGPNVGVSKPGELRSAGILEAKLLTSAQSERVRATLTASSSFGGEGMRCFIPGLGFTVGNGAEAVEILVCLRCYWAFIFRGETRMTEALSEAGHRQLSEIYLELFPGSDPEAA